ncbi:hypothetical protein JG687_00019436 [Phytophthora cactorum]|uniref:Uncharacterized protein n=1 Tax=Phytophthora cactorum TaxID=29920 RepID=A0A8T1TKG1_9STRA|nr:hypothetical protein JG687_00019436 [Phytophthora cactorum]
MENLESNRLTKSISPILIGDSAEIYRNGYIWIKKNMLQIFGKESDRPHPSVLKSINWKSTLAAFMDMVKEKGLSLTQTFYKDRELYSKPYQTASSELKARKGVKTGIDKDMDRDIELPESDAKHILTLYFQELLDKHINPSFPVRIVVKSINGNEIHPSYYIGHPMRDRILNIRDRNHNPLYEGKVLEGLNKKTSWIDTFNLLIEDFERIYDSAPAKERDNIIQNEKILNLIIGTMRLKEKLVDPDNSEDLQRLLVEAEAAYLVYEEAQKRLKEATQSQKGSNSIAKNSALKASRAAAKASKVVYEMKMNSFNKANKNLGFDTIADKVNRLNIRNNFSQLPKGSGRKGRGLMGAGVAPLEGVVRRGRTYNLNEIQGSATPSAYIYRQLGSKYIRLPDLDAKTLVIVQPNRRKCGPKCHISDSLQAMIQTLVYKNHIDQASYDKLSIDDKKLFIDILAITHLQYNFHDKLDDPFERLRAEYDKLKGELELGNDNRSIIKQLKSLTVDMYSNRLIGDKEFKEIITRLLQIMKTFTALIIWWAIIIFGVI